VHDLAGRGRMVDARELDPFDMPDNGELHVSHLEPGLRFTPW
jgi:hypothetical protein